MAYRKQWYTFGARTNADAALIPVSEIKNGDTYFSLDWQKPMYMRDMSLLPNYGSGSQGKIWTNDDMFVGYAPNTGLYLLSPGTVVSINFTTLYADNDWDVTLSPAVASYNYKYFCGVVAVGTSPTETLRAVAIQGIYNVKFTASTTTVTAGNLAILSETPGEASQTGTTASIGVVGVIMETKTLGVDRLAKVMIQSFSSK